MIDFTHPDMNLIYRVCVFMACLMIRTLVYIRIYTAVIHFCCEREAKHDKPLL